MTGIIRNQKHGGNMSLTSNMTIQTIFYFVCKTHGCYINTWQRDLAVRYKAYYDVSQDVFIWFRRAIYDGTYIYAPVTR